MRVCIETDDGWIYEDLPDLPRVGDTMKIGRHIDIVVNVLWKRVFKDSWTIVVLVTRKNKVKK